YLTSPVRRRRVTFARRFLAAVDRRPTDAVGKAVRRLAWPLALAATLLLTIGALVMENVNLRTGLNQALHLSEAGDRRARGLPTEPDAAGKPTAQLTRKLKDAHATPSGSGHGVTTSPPAPAIVLLPQTRSVGPLPMLAVAPTGVVPFVPFDLRLESRDFLR